MPFNLPEAFLLAAEQALGVQFPPAYRDAMRLENGGELEAGEDDWHLYPIADTSDRRRLARSVSHVLNETQRCRTWPAFPADAVAIAGNGAGDQLVFLRKQAGFDPTVYVWSHETGQCSKVANDFADLGYP